MPFGMPEHQPRAGFFRNAEQIQFPSQLSMIPLFGLFQLLQVLGQFFGRQESRAVDPLQLLADARPRASRNRRY